MHLPTAGSRYLARAQSASCERALARVHISALARVLADNSNRITAAAHAGLRVVGTQQLAMDYAPMGGRIVVLGVCMAPDTTSPVKALTKELQVNYAYMYRRQEFELSIDLMNREMIDPTPMVTGTLSFDEFPQTFEALKTDKSACKMLLVP